MLKHYYYYYFFNANDPIGLFFPPRSSHFLDHLPANLITRRGKEIIFTKKGSFGFAILTYNEIYFFTQ